jgi:hypothetical protein
MSKMKKKKEKNKINSRKENILTKIEAEETKKTILEKILEKIYKKELYKVISEEDKNLIEQLTIKFNLIIQKYINEKWKEERLIRIKTTDWLPSIIIKNLDTFYHFLTIHWFIPILQDIIIKPNDKEEIKLSEIITLHKLVNIFKLFLKINNSFPYPIFSEINKLKEEFENNLNNLSDFVENDWLAIWLHINSLMWHILRIKETNWKNLDRIKNIDSIYHEIIFTEIALRYENIIRTLLPNIKSTYLLPATNKEDLTEKTDFNFVISIENKFKIENNDAYKINIQFYAPEINHSVKTIEKKIKNFNNKLERKEKNVLSKIDEISEKSKFFIIAAPYSTINLKSGKNKVKKKLKKWFFNKVIRENTKHENHFPLFINLIPEKELKEYIIIYFFLHLLPFDELKNCKFDKISLKYLKNHLEEWLKKINHIIKENIKINVQRFSYKTEEKKYNIIRIILLANDNHIIGGISILK